MTNFDLRLIDATQFNNWQCERHYLKRKIIRSKLLAHGIYVNNELVGGLLWATPHFTKKRGLFGFDVVSLRNGQTIETEETNKNDATMISDALQRWAANHPEYQVNHVVGLDKWEVLMLARFYLVDDCGVIASEALSESIGRQGRRGKSRKRGWRLQQDWCAVHPPKYPEKPFVPRMLISWSDTLWGHKGIIYDASGWQRWDITKSGGIRTGRAHWINSQHGDEVPAEYRHSNDGLKQCWIMRLDENKRAYDIGLNEYTRRNGVVV